MRPDEYASSRSAGVTTTPCESGDDVWGDCSVPSVIETVREYRFYTDVHNLSTRVSTRVLDGGLRGVRLSCLRGRTHTAPAARPLTPPKHPHGVTRTQSPPLKCRNARAKVTEEWLLHLSSSQSLASASGHAYSPKSDEMSAAACTAGARNWCRRAAETRGPSAPSERRYMYMCTPR